MKRLFLVLVSLFYLIFCQITYANEVALVYAGPGACDEGCASAAAQALSDYGVSVLFVTPKTLTPAILKKALMWVQPGGDAIEVAHALSAQQKTLLKDFVKNGKPYLGFCAGAFFADTKVDDANTIDGLGFVPGITYDYKTNEVHTVLPINWLSLPSEKQLRHVYFEEGGFFQLNPGAQVNILANYTGNIPAAVHFSHGKGQVVLSFPHPEAPNYWKERSTVPDLDGPDEDLVFEMIRRALTGK